VGWVGDVDDAGRADRGVRIVSRVEPGTIRVLVDLGQIGMPADRDRYRDLRDAHVVPAQMGDDGSFGVGDAPLDLGHVQDRQPFRGAAQIGEIENVPVIADVQAVRPHAEIAVQDDGSGRVGHIEGCEVADHGGNPEGATVRREGTLVAQHAGRGAGFEDRPATVAADVVDVHPAGIGCRVAKVAGQQTPLGVEAQ
jgi:hypothetical protein